MNFCLLSLATCGHCLELVLLFLQQLAIASLFQHARLASDVGSGKKTFNGIGERCYRMKRKKGARIVMAKAAS
eukprot:4638939-Amphidinium_carterae.1